MPRAATSPVMPGSRGSRGHRFPERPVSRSDRRRYDGGDAPDALGGGAAPHLHRRRAGPASPRCRAPPERPRGGRAHLRRDARGRAGRGAATRRSRRRVAAAVAADRGDRGVRELVDEVRLEVLMDDGTRLVVLSTRSAATAPTPIGPGAVRPATGDAPRQRRPRDASSSTVRSESSRVIRVSSHYPFERVNRAARLRSRRGAPASASTCRPARPSAGRRARRGRSAWSGTAARRRTSEPALPGGAARPLRPHDRRPRPARRHRPVGPRRRGPPGARRRADLGLREDHPAPR